MRKLDILGHDRHFAFGIALVTAIVTLLDWDPPSIAGMIVSTATLWAICSVLAIYVVDDLSIEKSVKFRHHTSILLICAVTFFTVLEIIMSVLTN